MYGIFLSLSLFFKQCKITKIGLQLLGTDYDKLFACVQNEI